MALTITGQKPAVLDPVHMIAINGDYDPVKAIKKSIVNPFFKPMTRGTKVSITDANGTNYDKGDLLALVLSALGGNVNPAAESDLKALFQQGLVNYDQTTPLLVNEVFAVQAAHANRLPHPGPRTIYTAAHDVIPAAKNLIGGHSKDDSEFFASLAYAYSPEALGFWFNTAADFDDFKVWLAAQTASLSSVLPGDTLNLLQRFSQLSLKTLVEGYVLRADDSDQNEEYSFARVIVNMLMQYQSQSQGVTGVLPFVVSELFAPRTIVLVNVEAHARATPKRVDSEWKLINASLSMPVKVISNKALSRLTALPRAAAKAAALAANAQSNRTAQTGRSAKITFRQKPPSKVQIEKGLLRVLKFMKEVNRSLNVLKKVKTTYSKANRRDPMDYNKPGKTVSTHYLPDLHVYADTSGSISEVHYQDAVLMMIKVAKKLNVDLYFNSFSHVMSQETLIRTKGKSVARIWEEFRRLPKVNGGTEFKQIWDYINASPKRKQRLSLVITDFGWTASTQRSEHPKNLYYAPCSSYDWQSIVHMADGFVKSMQHIEPAIARRLIGLIN